MNIELKTQNVAALRPLAGKVALVMGSTSGIGLGIARALAEAGSASPTMPASNMSRRSTGFRSRNGTRSRRSTCRRRFTTTRLALPAMRQNTFGRIINIASAHGLVESPFKAVAAKHAIVGLTKVTALETAEDGITCNAICPYYVYTPLVVAQIDGQAQGARHFPRAGRP